MQYISDNLLQKTRRIHETEKTGKKRVRYESHIPMQLAGLVISFLRSLIFQQLYAIWPVVPRNEFQFVSAYSARIEDNWEAGEKTGSAIEWRSFDLINSSKHAFDREKHSYLRQSYKRFMRRSEMYNHAMFKVHFVLKCSV